VRAWVRGETCDGSIMPSINANSPARACGLSRQLWGILYEDLSSLPRSALQSWWHSLCRPASSLSAAASGAGATSAAAESVWRRFLPTGA